MSARVQSKASTACPGEGGGAALEAVRRVVEEARRAVPVVDLAGREVRLRRAGREFRGPCPLCGAGAGGKGTPPFAASPETGKWRCFACLDFGDVVDLERALRGGTVAEAARRLAGAPPGPAAQTERPAPTAKGPSEPSGSARIAAELLAGSRPVTGTLAERYLRARGIAPDVIACAAANLRYHPGAKWGWDGARREWIKAPALILPVVVAGPGGAPVPTGGVHATYLARDGQSKAALEPAKRMWGPQSLDGRPGGAWLIGPRGTGALVVGEGAETVLSVVTLALAGSGEVMRACAALSLGRLQGGELRDGEGLIDPYRPRPDPERAPFVWPLPEGATAWPEVLVAIDRDMSPVRVRARTPRGRLCDFLRDGEARARLCARLASAAWKSTGARVRVLMPPPGSDWNDELRRRAARGGLH